MPIGGLDQKTTMGSSYRKNPMHEYAQAFNETATMILKEDGYDIFEEPQRVLRRGPSRDAMKKFFCENAIDTKNSLYDAYDIEDMQKMNEQMFENDTQALMENTAPADIAPMVGLALPIHKLILMNNVFDKGVIQKAVAALPKFPISIERRILVKPDGTEIDMFLQQNMMTDAIDSTNPEKEIELTLPVTESTDIVATHFGGSALDHLDISTYICAVLVENVQIDVGDIEPNEQGYIDRDGKIATVQSTKDVWFRTDIRFTPNYGGPNSYDRTVTCPLTINYKDANNSGSITEIKSVITGSMNKDRFNIDDLGHKITKIRLKAKLDSSSAMMETCSTTWKVDTDIIEIPNSPAINTTISPNEIKDISAMYNVNQLTKHMSMFKTALSNYKDDKIKRGLDESYKRLDERTGFYDKFDFAPPAEYALTALEYRQKMFMDFLDHFCSKMLQVLNDPNMTFSIVGDPLIIRKITPKEYSYVAPSKIGPVTLDYSQTICNMTDKRVYNFVGSDKMRNTNELMILINPNNSERVIYRIYDYQMYVSNEIRNITNPALPAIHAFERWKLVEYMPVQGRVKILNETGLRTE